MDIDPLAYPQADYSQSGGALAQLLTQIFGTGAAAAAAPKPMPSIAPAQGGPFAGVSGRVGGGSPAPAAQPASGDPLNLVQGSTPTGSRSTPIAQQPGGNLLVRLQGPQPPTMGDPTGAGAVKAIEMAKGKSKWGAIASGLAAGMQAQEAAQSQYGKSLNEYLNSLYTRDKDAENMRRQGELSGAQAKFYKALAERGEARSGTSGGSGSSRTITPEERAFRYAMAEREIRQNAQNRMLTGDALEQEVARQLEFFGFKKGQSLPPVSGAPQSAVGSGQPVNVPPGAPPGTPPARLNPAPAPPAPAADPLARAREAIARGADRNAVIDRLRQNGIDPSGL